MMKIHTTQNLNSLVQLNQLSSNNVSSKDFRLKNYSEQMLMPKLSADKAELYGSSISFGKKKPTVKDAKKIIDMAKKGVGEIVKEPQIEKKKGDGFITGSFFNKALDVTDYETVATAAVAAVGCTARGSTISILPTKKNKQDNKYAASHAYASAAIGLGTAALLTAPFKAGSNYVMEHMKKNLKKETLERLWPHLDTNSIVNADGSRKEISEWLDRNKNKFVETMKKCEQMPVIRNLADASEQTFNKLLLKEGKEVDWVAQKGKSFNDVVLKDGSKLYDEINMSRLGIFVKEEGMPEAQIMLNDFNKDFLEKLVKDAKDAKSYWGDLDVKSVYDENGEVVDFRKWKNVNGKQWKLDLDEIGVSSPYETADYKPRISGKKRLDKKDNVYKYSSYQENGVNGKLGTEIKNDMVEADAANDGLFKALTWGPDLLFRVPVAALTIALIPWVLKKAFNIEKSSSKNKTEQKPVSQQPVNTKQNEKTAAVSFKGKTPSGEKGKGFFDKMMKSIGKLYAKLYGRRLIESETVHKFSAWLSKLPGNVTQHMTAFGSLITSSVYMQQTLTKKDLDPDRRRTLAINQGLCFVVPTLAAYTVDKGINNWVKRKEYRYSGLTQRMNDIAKLEGKEAVMDAKTLSHKLKGFRTLSSITVFALIYRYFTPVLMTPVANWFGDKINAKKAEAKAIEIELQSENKNTAKEVSINSDNKTETSKNVA